MAAPEGVITTRTLSCDRIPIPLGRQGENAARQIRFSLKDFAPYLSVSPGSPDEAPSVSLLVRRPGEAPEAPYPVPLTFEEGENGIPRAALWTPSLADTALWGQGECELRLSAGETLMKSRRYPFTVEKALGQVTDPPAPWQPWVDGVLGAAESVQTAAAALADHSETVADIAEELEETRNRLDLKAPAGGLCEALTAGCALRLADPEAQSLSLQTGDEINLSGTGLRGRAIGRVNALFGQTCVKNQLCDPQDTRTSTAGGVTYTNNGDGTWTLTGSGTGTNRKPISNIRCVPGHKYYMAHGSGSVSSGSWHVCVTSTGSHLTGTNQNPRLLFTASYAFDAFSIRTTSGFRPPEEGIILHPVLVDITLLYGEGREPETANEVLKRFPDIERWDHDPGSLLHMTASELICRESTPAETEGFPGAGADLAAAMAEYFPGGMMSAGDIRDELNENRAIRRCEAADGTVVPLPEPVISPIFPPLSLTLPLYEGGRMEALTTDGSPTAPARILLTPLPDVTRTVKSLPRDYVSLQSLDALLSALQNALDISIIRAWDETAEKWGFTVSGP